MILNKKIHEIILKAMELAKEKNLNVAEMYTEAVKSTFKVQDTITTPIIVDCSNCQHRNSSKYVAPCYGCRDNDGYEYFEPKSITE